MGDHLQHPQQPHRDVEAHGAVLELPRVHQTGCRTETQLLQLNINTHIISRLLFTTYGEILLVIGYKSFQYRPFVRLLFSNITDFTT